MCHKFNVLGFQQPIPHAALLMILFASAKGLDPHYDKCQNCSKQLQAVFHLPNTTRPDIFVLEPHYELECQEHQNTVGICEECFDARFSVPTEVPVKKRKQQHGKK